MNIQLDENFLEELKSNIHSLYLSTIEQAQRDSAMNKELLSIREATKFLDLSRTSFTQHIINQGLPTYMIGSKIYVMKSELIEFVKNQRIS